MLTLVFIPFGFGIGLYLNSQRIDEPELPVEIKFDFAWVGDSETERRLVPCIEIRNTASTAFGKLSVGLNEQFYSTGNMNVAGNEVATIPLESFIAHNGSIHFPVGSRPIGHVIVFGQLPSGARGVAEFVVEPENNATPTEWLAPAKSTKDRSGDISTR